jgi:HK97 family phage major capsid protein
MDKQIVGDAWRDLPRIARTLAWAQLQGEEPRDAAEVLYPGTHISRYLGKAAVDSIDTDSDLYSPRNLTSQFAASVRKVSILGRIPEPVRVPLTAPLPWVSARSTFAFVGEGAPFPAKALTFGSNVQLKEKKCGGIIAYSKELLSHADRAEAVIRDEMIAAVAEALDTHLLDPSKVVSAVQPASVTNGTPEYDGSTATDAEGVDEVCGALLSVLTGSNYERCVFITTHTNAIALSLMRDTGGGRAFPGVTVQGGTLAGLPLIASGAAPADVLTLLDASELLVGDEDQMTITASMQAFIEQDDAPDGDNSLVSMFQTESVALLVSRIINWQMRRDGHVAYASNFAPTVPEASTA